MDALKRAVLERKRAVQGGEPIDNKASRTNSDSDEEESSSSSEEGIEETSALSGSDLPLAQAALVEDDSDFGKVLRWIRLQLNEWREHLNAAPTIEQQTAKGRDAERAYKDCEHSLQPLVEHLRTRTLEKNILDHLVGIIHECSAREYRRAFDRYIQLTIGNAPWPIGVTMVGIHARSGREQIAESKVKHIMKDDTVRAYLTSFKRLMTQCQNLHPPDAPSKRMN